MFNRCCCTFALKTNLNHITTCSPHTLQAQQRAQEFGIAGVTYRLAQGVVKNIIPAVASTNAVIAAACSNEVFKLATSCTPHLNNYMVFNDADGVYAYTFEYERKVG